MRPGEPHVASHSSRGAEAGLGASHTSAGHEQGRLCRAQPEGCPAHLPPPLPSPRSCGAHTCPQAPCPLPASQGCAPPHLCLRVRAGFPNMPSHGHVSGSWRGRFHGGPLGARWVPLRTRFPSEGPRVGLEWVTDAWPSRRPQGLPGQCGSRPGTAAQVRARCQSRVEAALVQFGSRVPGRTTGRLRSQAPSPRKWSPREAPSEWAWDSAARAFAEPGRPLGPRRVVCTFSGPPTRAEGPHAHCFQTQADASECRACWALGRASQPAPTCSASGAQTPRRGARAGPWADWGAHLPLGNTGGRACSRQSLWDPHFSQRVKRSAYVFI